MPSREQSWADVHDPDTSARRLAEIAEEHPEFAEAIARHPHCYPALAAWAAGGADTGGSAAQQAPAASALTPRDTPKPSEETGPPSRRLSRRTTIFGGALVALFLLAGAAAVVWAAVGRGSSPEDTLASALPSAAAAPTPAPTPTLGARVLDGPPVYIGDELDWFLPSESTVTSLAPGATAFTAGQSLFTVGEYEGVGTAPEQCGMIAFGDLYAGAVAGIRTLRWTSDAAPTTGSVVVQQFPSGDLAGAEFHAVADNVPACGNYTITQGGVNLASYTTQVVAEATNAVVYTSAGVSYDGAPEQKMVLVMVEGNVTVQVTLADRDVAVPTSAADLLAEVQQLATAARTRLTEEIGYH